MRNRPAGINASSIPTELVMSLAGPFRVGSGGCATVPPTSSTNTSTATARVLARSTCAKRTAIARYLFPLPCDPLLDYPFPQLLPLFSLQPSRSVKTVPQLRAGLADQGQLVLPAKLAQHALAAGISEAAAQGGFRLHASQGRGQAGDVARAHQQAVLIVPDHSCHPTGPVGDVRR